MNVVRAADYALIGASQTWIIAIVDCARRRFPDSTEKIVWILVIIFSHCVGAGVYWLFGRPRGRVVS